MVERNERGVVVRVPPEAQLGSLPLPWWVGEFKTTERVQLYVKGEGDDNDVDGNDVQQGQLNDCFLMAGISAVVRSHPYPDAFIGNLITDHGDGTYTVTFFDSDEPTGKRAVRVNSDFYPSPANSGRGTGEEKERWAAVVERAYFKAYGEMGVIEQGGSPGPVMERLTGLPGMSMPLDLPAPMAAVVPKMTFERLAELHKSGSAITFSSFQKGSERAQQDAYQQAKYAEKLFGTHAYVMTNIDAEKKTVTVKNPHNYEKDIVIPYDEVEKVFEGVHSNPVSGLGK